MKVILAKEYGFCHGVRVALQKLDAALEANPGKKVYSIGEIIHNQDVINAYAAKGVDIVDSVFDVKDGVGVVRAHGLPASIIAEAQSEGMDVIDATCPFVRKISRIIEQEIPKGHKIFLIGEPEHPEVIAATRDFSEYVTVVDYKDFDPGQFSHKMKSCAVISQTTMSTTRFEEIAAHFQTICSTVQVYDTICPSTKKRQSAAIETAHQADCMIVLGGTKSSNTKRLFEICSKIVPSVHLERISQLDPAFLKGKKTAGVTAGASTPDWIVQEAVEYLEKAEEN